MKLKDAIEEKNKVQDFWEKNSCGEIYAQGKILLEKLERQGKERYCLEPYIFEFARFCDGFERDVLEIGVGMGADHLEWAKSNPRTMTGIDLTQRAINHTLTRLEQHGYLSNLLVADAEKLPFKDNSFDIVYSWGVIHHSPNTTRAIKEILRVLRPGGTARIMIYHYYSLVGYMLWFRYALLSGKPRRTLADIYANHLESPGTKAYSVSDAQKMFSGFSRVDAFVQLSFGDLLQGAVGQKHGGILLSVAKAIWPQWLIKKMFSRYGLYLLIEAVK